MLKVAYWTLHPYPHEFAFTMDPVAFKKELKKLGLDDTSEFPKQGASVHTFVNENGSVLYFITMVNEKRPLSQMASLIAHEATHIVQNLWEDIGEKEPGKEAEAYLLQHIVQCCLEQMGPKFTTTFRL